MILGGDTTAGNGERYGACTGSLPWAGIGRREEEVGAG